MNAYIESFKIQIFLCHCGFCRYCSSTMDCSLVL